MSACLGQISRQSFVCTQVISLSHNLPDCFPSRLSLSVSVCPSPHTPHPPPPPVCPCCSKNTCHEVVPTPIALLPPSRLLPFYSVSTVGFGGSLDVILIRPFCEFLHSILFSHSRSTFRGCRDRALTSPQQRHVLFRSISSGLKGDRAAHTGVEPKAVKL